MSAPMPSIRVYYSVHSVSMFCWLCGVVNYKWEAAHWNRTSAWKLGGKSGKQHYKVDLFVVLDFAIYKQLS